MTGEMVRDQALAASGLLVRQVGGRSVRPYQPPGLWKELASASSVYQPEQGGNLYRRTMYTFWRRTIPPPQLILFDAPNRELCTARRPRTSTPLQSLVLMNAPAYVEAARYLADDLLARELSNRQRLVEAFQAMIVRKPSARELKLLTVTWEHFRRRYASDIEAARKFVQVGYSKPRSSQLADLAALTATVSMIMNLDEAVTRE